MSDESPVLVSVDAERRIGTLTLNRPDKRNALNGAVVEAAHAGLGKLTADRSIRVIVLRGNGTAFCAGADLDAIRALSTATHDENLKDSRRLAAFIEALVRCPKPTVAAVHGPALAGGAGLASACDFVIATPEATFGYPEVKIGFVAAIVMVLLVRQVGERKARDLLLTGRVIPAREAMALGLVNDLVPPDSLDAAILLLAKSLVHGSPAAISRTKELLLQTWDRELSEAIHTAASANADARGTPDCREGIAAFLEKRKPVWPQG